MTEAIVKARSASDAAIPLPRERPSGRGGDSPQASWFHHREEGKNDAMPPAVYGCRAPQPLPHGNQRPTVLPRLPTLNRVITMQPIASPGEPQEFHIACRHSGCPQCDRLKE